MERTKAERFQEVEEKVLVLVAEVGIEGLSLSSVARAADVSRAWIYKYLGGEIPALVESAASAFGRRFTELDAAGNTSHEARSLTDFRKDLKNSVIKTLDEVERFPWLTQLYFKHLGAQDPIGRVIDELEQEYVNTRAPIFGNALGLSGSEAKTAVTLFMKTRLALAHSHRVQANFKALGRETVAEMVISTLPWVDHRSTDR